MQILYTDMIDDLMDEPDHDEGPESPARICHDCHRETAGEICGFCGNDLCPACFEMGAGFCSAAHTPEQIDDYEHEVYGTPREELARRRQVRSELKSLGLGTL